MSADSPRSASTAREAVLAAFSELERASGRREFGLRDVVDHVLSQTSTWRESTLRTHVANHMCVDAPEHLHADLERVGRGCYRRISTGPASAPDHWPGHEGCEPQAMEASEELDVRLRVRWLYAGDITLGTELLACPALPAAPGVYRLTIASAAGATELHIGESENLRRRVNQYRLPGVSQLANIRLNERMIRGLASGGRVEVHIITEATATQPDGERPLDLRRKEIRRLIESLVAVMSQPPSPAL